MEKELLHILLVSKQQSSLDTFKAVLQARKRTAVSHVDSAIKALQLINKKKVDVAIVSDELLDKSGLQFITELVVHHPFINCTLISPLYPHEFHKQTEGLGVFMQLPVNPGAEAAAQVIEHLDRIYQVTNQFLINEQTT